jgi:SAM-dependent methyltransferase
MSGGANSEQEKYWNEQAGPKWVAMQSVLDAMLRPIGLLAMERLGGIDGRSVLDVGCGCGATTIELARRVGANGSVLGVDVSRPMLERARQSALEQGVTNASFRLGDAQTERFTQRFDTVFSRFGVMFFADPQAAFANLRGAMVEDGSLSFACWRSIDQNEWMMVPVAAALQHVPPPEMPPPGAPGPFAFADGDRVERILIGAGFTGVEVEPLETMIRIGGGRTLAEVADFTLQLGPTARILQESPPELKARVAASIAEALQPYYADGEVAMKGALWLVRARNTDS